MSSFKTINARQARFIEATKAEIERPHDFVQLPGGARAASGSSGGQARKGTIVSIGSSSFVANIDGIPDVTINPTILNSADLTSNSWPRLSVGLPVFLYRDSPEDIWRTSLVFDKIINVNTFV